ncbi:MAG: 4-hydroxy-tetrahydrodipicolinate reductase, partial [Paraglaciecola sp.]
MNKIAIFGANGRMGRVLIEALDQTVGVQLSGAFVRPGSSLSGVDVGELAGIGKRNLKVNSEPASEIDNIDIFIDFTLPQALEANLALCVKHLKPVVIGTTGLNETQKQALQDAARHIPIVFAANYSIGVNLLLNLARHTARVLGETADIEIIETHHRFKKDA